MKPLGGEEVREKGPRTAFHYSREERLSMRQGEPNESPKRWLRGNRHLIITFIDLVIVLGLLLLYLFFLRPAAARANVGDFRITGRAFAYGQETLVTLTIVSRERADTAAAETARIATRQVQIDAAGETFYELLPAPGEELRVRFAVPGAARESIQFRFTVGADSGRMTLQVVEENVD